MVIQTENFDAKTTRTMPAHKHIALVAHDNYKPELLRWVKKTKKSCNATFFMPLEPQVLC